MILHTADHVEIWERFLGPETKLILEIGSFYGHSTKALAKLAPNAKIVCIEPFAESKDFDSRFKSLAKKAKMNFLKNTRGLNITLVEKFSSEALPELADLNPDVIYIDGSHEFEDVVSDIEMCLTLFPNSVLVGDDLNMEGVKAAFDLFSSRGFGTDLKEKIWYFQPNKKFDILSTVTGDHFKYLEYQYLNLMEYAKEPLEFHVFYAHSYSQIRRKMTGPSKRDIDRLRSIVSRSGHSVKFYDLTSYVAWSLNAYSRNVDSDFSIAGVLRILAPEVLKDRDRILYLDSDVFALNDFITPFSEIDLEGYDVAGMPNDFKESYYLNSGVLVFNLKELRKSLSHVFATSRLNDPDLVPLQYPDQDAINMFYSKKIIRKPEYNLMNRYLDEKDALTREQTAAQGVVFEHFYGHGKKIDSEANKKYAEYRKLLEAKIEHLTNL